MVSAAALPLPQLAQELAQKQSALDKARQAFDSRLAKLRRRKEQLQAQLRTVEAEMQAVGATVPASSPPKAAAAADATHAILKAPRVPAASTLPGLLVDLVRAAGRPLTVKEMTASVVRAKFPTTSRNLSKLVKNKIGALVKRGLLRRAEGRPGVVVAQPQATRQAPAAKATAYGPTSGRNGQAAPKAAARVQPAKPVQGQAQVSLAEVLLRLLAKSSRPLKARELAAQALAAGYRTASKEFTNLVWDALGKLPGVENVRGQGYRLKKRPVKAK
jgi:hypothetical protein